MDIASLGSPALWAAFAAGVAIMLALDLGVFHRHAHVVPMKEATIWTGVWVALALMFNGFIWWRFGAQAGEEFLTGYAIEKALSVDNLFVIYVVFTAFAIPREHQHRILFWGILGAIAMRTIMVFAGTSLLTHFHWLVFVFGAFLVFTGIKMLVRREERPHPEQSRLLRFVRRRLPVTDEIHGSRLFVRLQNGDGTKMVVKATPLFLSLVFIEASDAVFAVDSIFAIFAITLDPFIVLTSNICALLGLRTLYFVLSGAATRFRYVQPGLALVLVFVGVKMAIADWVHIPVLVSLAVIVALIGGSIALSVWKTRRTEVPRDEVPVAR